MNYLTQQLVNGLTLGSIYALIALGYTLIYGVLQLLNFAHGDVYMVGSFAGYFTMIGLGGPNNPVVPIWVMILLMFLAGMVVSGGLGVMVEKFAYRPLHSSPRITSLISALGVSLFLESAVVLLFGSKIRNYETTEYIPIGTGIHLGGVTIEPMRILLILLSGTLMVVLILVVNKTRLGRGMRAVAYDSDAAIMMGVDVNRVIMLTFLIASVLAGAAGVMVGLVYFTINNYMGFLAGLKAFAAAVVGGIGSITGAVLGGLLIGFLESFAAGYLSPNFANVITFAALIVVMLVKPRGLLGRSAIVKV